MEIKQYLDSRNISQKEFAELMGISEAAVSHYYNRRRTPHLEIAMRIVGFTKGKVDYKDLLVK